MTQVMVIGFIDLEEKPHMREGGMTHCGQTIAEPDYTVRFRPEDLIRVDYEMLFNVAWRNGLRSICRAKGYYPSMLGAIDGGRFDPVYIIIDQQIPPHMVGGPPIDNRKTQA